tara:strand:- start:784 stop:1467 length:684 start_codon:yes stop_codon:yes gene_type:complete
MFSAQDNYKWPINHGEKNTKIMKPLNLVAMPEINPYVSVKKGDPITYDELRFYALYNCKNRKNPTQETERIIDTLISVEKQYNPPPSMRGMLLAAACSESGYNHKAKGDHKFSKNKKKPMAIGILQLWPIYNKMYPGLDRTDPEQAAQAWMHHIIKKIPKVRKQCKYKKPNKVWLAAWVTGIRYKKVGGRCKERPLHYRILKKWHRAIREDRMVTEECQISYDGCGC